MNKYELALVIKPSDDALYKAELEKAQALITRFGGVIDKVDEWGKRRLAYEINKLTEGHYCFITFTADADAPSQIEQRLRIAENVLRYLIIKAEQ